MSQWTLSKQIQNYLVNPYFNQPVRAVIFGFKLFFKQLKNKQIKLDKRAITVCKTKLE